MPGINETAILTIGMLLSSACICIDICLRNANANLPEPKLSIVGKGSRPCTKMATDARSFQVQRQSIFFSLSGGDADRPLHRHNLAESVFSSAQACWVSNYKRERDTKRTSGFTWTSAGSHVPGWTHGQRVRGRHTSSVEGSGQGSACAVSRVML